MSDLPELASAKTFRTKQEQVYQTLRSGILDGSLEPGRRLVIDDIAKSLSCSPIPVREALAQLQSERLIHQRPHQGAVVSTPDPDSIRELFTLMECIEVAAARLAPMPLDPPALARLHHHLADLDTATPETWGERNSAFHRALIDLARMPRLAELAGALFTDWERLRRLHYRDRGPGDAAAAQQEHRQMVDALATGDRATLEALSSQHNRAALAIHLAPAPR